jgi:hypothetical protein
MVCSLIKKKRKGEGPIHSVSFLFYQELEGLIDEKNSLFMVDPRHHVRNASAIHGPTPRRADLVHGRPRR